MNTNQYARTKTEIYKLIDNLRNRGNSVLPTEQQLSEQLNVGRNTLRKVVGGLVDEGLLKRIQGKGTFIVNKLNELSFSNWISSELSPERFMEKLIKEHEQQERNIVVKDIAIPYYQYVNKLWDLILHGNPPDVVQMNSYWLRRFQRLNQFIPLDPYISPQILKRRYTKAINLGKIGDEIIALNWTLDPLVLYYNKIALEKAGLDPDKAPRTLEELADMCARANQAKRGNLYSFCLPFDMYEHSFMCLYPFLLAFNGGFSDPIGNIIIDSQENVNALSWLAKICAQSGVSTPLSINDARILFASDFLCFLVEAPAGRGHFRQISGLGSDFDDHYGVAKIPVGPSGRSESVLLSHSLSISKYSQDPESAYRWIEFLASDEKNAKIYYELFGMIPCNRNFLHSSYFDGDPFASILIQQIESASPGPVDHPLFLRSVPFLLKTLSQVIHGEREVHEGLHFIKDVIGIMAQAGTFNFI